MNYVPPRLDRVARYLAARRVAARQARPTDGGVTAPSPDGIIRNSALLRAELRSVQQNP